MKKEVEIAAMKREQAEHNANVVTRQNQLDAMMHYMLGKYNSNERIPQPMLHPMSQP